MSKIVQGLYYTTHHDWVKVDGNKAYVGATDYAQHALGDIVYVELPEVGEEFGVEDAYGVIESVKAASDAYAPLSGKIVEVNSELEDAPESINEAPYEKWLVAIEMSDASELEKLMDASAYEDFCNKEA
ncbi:glycine cleavage system H protein [Peptoclostridium acidaminophilum DSM 3953]|uniref:Glycine cleavage system H protein n=2 Tax=Peptoclostridium acidaminophilum TaxID=1731 RepID=W8T800_PEPAC|nr:glycine cleavage system protein GcvH [Peptoclostridium acidaminophilum]AAU84892.1 hydrogen carrier protein [Peptoclostridium acidaminophilum]AHM57015.1 glycine cleavage system H protein [Peptoclostridium acidaminophilum DSM 3953]